jgi:hypothetical protein
MATRRSTGGRKEGHSILPEAVGVFAARDEAGWTVGPDGIGDDDVDAREPGQQLPRVTSVEGGVAELDAFEWNDRVHAGTGQKVPGGPPYGEGFAPVAQGAAS